MLGNRAQLLGDGIDHSDQRRNTGPAQEEAEDGYPVAQMFGEPWCKAVFKGGGAEQLELALSDKVRSAADDALDRLFPDFKDADHKNWPVVIRRAKNGSDSPLEAVQWPGATEPGPAFFGALRVRFIF